MSEKFTRNIENFVCENCGNEVEGNGFTNHCPKCLYSKHVDVNPGDRKATCGGIMEPIDAYYKKNSYQIKHKCKSCGYEITTRTQDEDDITTFLDKLKDTKHFL